MWAWPVCFQVLAKSASHGSCPPWQEAHSPTNGFGVVPVRFPTPTYLPQVISTNLMVSSAVPLFWVRVT